VAGKLSRKVGKRYKFRQTEFWAENGSIKQLDHRKGPEPDYTVVSVRDMLLRARALNEQAKHMTYADERMEHIKLVEDIIACCKEARAQGDPFVESTFQDIRNMRDKHLLLPGQNIQAGNYVIQRPK
jgi:hypothetical protein